MADKEPANGPEAAAGTDSTDAQKVGQEAPQAEDDKSKRRSRMNSVKAEAIARLRNSEVPAELGFQYDTAENDDNDVEVVFKERTAL